MPRALPLRFLGRPGHSTWLQLQVGSKAHPGFGDTTGFKFHTSLGLKLPAMEWGQSSRLGGAVATGVQYKVAVTVTDDPGLSVVCKQGLHSGQVKRAVSRGVQVGTGPGKLPGGDWPQVLTFLGGLPSIWGIAFCSASVAGTAYGVLGYILPGPSAQKHLRPWA